MEQKNIKQGKVTIWCQKDGSTQDHRHVSNDQAGSKDKRLETPNKENNFKLLLNLSSEDQHLGVAFSLDASQPSSPCDVSS